MKPITIFSLGGTAPFEPNTDDRTMYGKAAAPNAVLQTLFKNCLRFMTGDISQRILPYQAQIRSA
jgi:hypothetical protein